MKGKHEISLAPKSLSLLTPSNLFCRWPNVCFTWTRHIPSTRMQHGAARPVGTERKACLAGLDPSSSYESIHYLAQEPKPSDDFRALKASLQKG